MDRVRTFPNPTYRYSREHPLHAIIAVVVAFLFFISSDNMHTLIRKLGQNWSMFVWLLGFFYFFSTPFNGKRTEPNYSNFSRWYIAWLLVAALYHFPNVQSIFGVDMMMNLSLFLTIYISSILFLLAFHIIFLGMWYMGLLAPVAGRRPDILTIIQNCAVTSVACCVLYSHCGDYATSKGRLFERRNFGWFSIWKKEEPLLNKFMHMNEELKDRVCSSWFALLGSASDYPVLSEWVIYEKLACNGSCPRISDNISPIYSLWLTIIGLYIANYVVGRSAGWALTHPLPVEVDNELKAKPDFLDMVPWYSGTSADLFKAVFDLLVYVNIRWWI